VSDAVLWTAILIGASVYLLFTIKLADAIFRLTVRIVEALRGKP